MGKDFLNFVTQEHLNTFCSIFDISQNDIENIYVNPGRSANNSNFVFVVNKKSYLYRIPGEGTDKFCSREREALAYKSLSKFNITDEVVYLCKETGIKVSKYYENSRIPLKDNKNEVKSCMDTLRKLHECDLNFSYKDTLFDRMERYRNFAYEVGGKEYYLEGFEEYLSNMRKFKEHLNKIDIKYCFTHGDASINNLLFTKEYDYPILIDMEFPAISDPFDDIATFCVDAEYRKDDILLMLEYYLRRKGTLEEQYHVLGLCAVAAMMWYSWAVYKCAVEENNSLFINFRNDYHQYVKEVFDSATEIYSVIE